MHECVLRRENSAIGWTFFGAFWLAVGSLYGQPVTLDCDSNPNTNAPNVAVVAYCSPTGSPGGAAGMAIRNGLCVGNLFNTVTSIDGDDVNGDLVPNDGAVGNDPALTAADLSAYDCVAVISEAGFSETDGTCGQDISGPLDPPHVLDIAGTELASYAADHGVALLGGTMGVVDFFGFRAEGLGSDMIELGPSPYNRGVVQGPTGGGPMTFSSPSGLCVDMLNGIVSGQYEGLRAYVVGTPKIGTNECAQMSIGGVAGRSSLAINAAGNVAAFTADPIEDSTMSDSLDYLHVLRNTVSVVCRPPGPLNVAFDVRPGGCPNPFNPDSNGTLPVAILGSPGVNVADIDVNSIEIFGLAPDDRRNLSDTGTPFTGLDPENPVFTACTSAGADGTVDLNLKFNFPEIAQALTNHVNAQLLKDQAHVLTITGTFATGPNAGKSFVGHDVVRIIKDGPLPLP